MRLKTLIGKKIVNVRKMTEDEFNKNCWTRNMCSVVIELDDGTKLWPTADPECSEGGCISGERKNGEILYLW